MFKVKTWRKLEDEHEQPVFRFSQTNIIYDLKVGATTLVLSFSAQWQPKNLSIFFFLPRSDTSKNAEKIFAVLKKPVHWLVSLWWEILL